MTPTLQAPGGGSARLLSRKEVAALFDVSPHTVYRWAREGRLPYLLTPGGRRRYPREEVERLAAASTLVHHDNGHAALVRRRED